MMTSIQINDALRLNMRSWLAGTGPLACAVGLMLSGVTARCVLSMLDLKVFPHELPMGLSLMVVSCFLVTAHSAAQGFWPVKWLTGLMGFLLMALAIQQAWV